MKRGYSLLLGEYIGAERASYEDSKLFQIVCPICKEPVFKVRRETEPSALHYFSHYDKDKAFDAECELRVEALSREAMDQENTDSRGQRLAYFLQVLQKEILATFYESATKVDAFAQKTLKQQWLYRWYLGGRVSRESCQVLPMESGSRR